MDHRENDNGERKQASKPLRGSRGRPGETSLVTWAHSAHQAFTQTRDYLEREAKDRPWKAFALVFGAGLVVGTLLRGGAGRAAMLGVASRLVREFAETGRRNVSG